MFNLHSFFNAIIITAALGAVLFENKGHFKKWLNKANSFSKRAVGFVNTAYNRFPINLRVTFEGSMYWAIFIIFIVVIVKWYIFNLGGIEFWSDEYAHLFSAKAFSETGKSVLPSGVPYVRSFLYTYLVAVSFKILGVSEASARIPSVITGIILLAVVYFSVSKISNRKVALISVVLLAFDPLYYWWARASRMYVLFALIFFAFLFAYYYAFEELVKYFKGKGDLLKLGGFGFLASSAYYLSYYMHPLALLVLPALIVYPLFHPEIKLSKKLFSIVLTASSLLLLIYFLFGAAIASRFIPPQLNIIKGSTFSFYYFKYFNNNSLPILGFTFFGIFQSFKKKDNIFIFLSVVVLITFLILSTIFANVTSGRFIIHFLPLVYIITAYGTWKLVININKKYTSLDKGLSYLLIGIVVVAVIFAGKTNLRKFERFDIEGPPDLKRASQKLKEQPDYNPDDDIVLSTLPLATLYYLDKTDFQLRQVIDERFIIKKKGTEVEMYSGAPLIRDSSQLQKILNGKKQVWIIIDDKRFKSFLSRGMKDIVGYNTKTVALLNGSRVLKAGNYSNSSYQSDPLFFEQ